MEFHPALNQSAIQAIFQKGINPTIDSYSAFFDNDHQHKTQLDHWLKKITLTIYYRVSNRLLCKIHRT